MSRIARILAAVFALAIAGSASLAGAAPLFTIAGVINNGTIASFFGCTNTSTGSVVIGVDVFGPGGNQLVTATSNLASLAPQATILFGTSAAAGFSVDSNISPGPVSKGSARIVTSSRKVVCTAFLADPIGNPPVSMTNLTIVTKGTQAGD